MQVINKDLNFPKLGACLQLRGHGGFGCNCPHLCQDGARDLLKIDEKMGVGRG